VIIFSDEALPVSRASSANPSSLQSELQVDRDLLTRLVRIRWQTQPKRVERIPAGLGLRRFYRIELEASHAPTSVIARMEPPAPVRTAAIRRTSDELASLAPSWLAEPPLEPLRGFLEDAGLPVPCSYFHDATLGIDLLEDLGDRRLSDLGPEARETGYRAACALVPRLQALAAAPNTIPAFGRVFDAALVETKAWKWIHWAVPALLGRAPRPSESKAIEKGFRLISEDLEKAPRRLAHRDFKAENLLVLDGDVTRRGGARLAMIDVQGAFLAPPEYDLVCLLYDLQVDLPERQARTLLDETLPSLPDRPAPEQAALRFDQLALLRLCKDVSHVVHAGLEHGDTRRWHEIPRGLDLIEGTALRLQPALPRLRELTSVIQALTQEARSSDSRGWERAR
jgi:aminoglycoside/choline kinase family phosphotransferase